MYLMQLPNLNIPVFVPRTARLSHLRRVNNIAVDISPVTQKDSSGRDYLYVPDKEPNQLISSLWLSLRINLNKLNKLNIQSIGTDELSLVGTLAAQDLLHETSIYTLTKAIDALAQKEGVRVSLMRMNKWTDLLLALIEGYTVMVGGTEYESFSEAERTGIVYMPKPGEALLNGHIFNVVAFDQEKDMALLLGNRGMTVGKRGQFQCRGSYLRNLSICKDFFVLVPRVDHAGSRTADS